MNNYKIKEIQNYIKTNLSEKRYKHSLSVCDTAVKLNISNSFNIDEASIIYASLLHDCSRYMCLDDMKNILDKNEIVYNKNYDGALLHSKVSAIIAKNDFAIRDDDTLNAISFHTTGRASMSRLEKLIYASDYLDPLRKINKSSDIFNIAEKNFDKALMLIIKESISFVMSKEQYLDIDSINMYNENTVGTFSFTTSRNLIHILTVILQHRTIH